MLVLIRKKINYLSYLELQYVLNWCVQIPPDVFLYYVSFRSETIEHQISIIII